MFGPKRVGSVSRPKGFWFKSGPEKVRVWVLRWLDPKGLGLGPSTFGLNGVGFVGVWTQWGLGLFPDLKWLGLGCGSFSVWT